MNSERRVLRKHQVVQAMISATLGLILLVNTNIEMAVAQAAPSSIQKLTLSGAIDLAVKQNLDIQIANIDAARKQQELLGARSTLLPHAGFDANDAVTRYNTKAVLGVPLRLCPSHEYPFAWLIGDPDEMGYEILFSFSSPTEKERFLDLIRSNDDLGKEYVDTDLIQPVKDEVRIARPFLEVLPRRALTRAILVATTVSGSIHHSTIQ